MSLSRMFADGIMLEAYAERQLLQNLKTVLFPVLFTVTSPWEALREDALLAALQNAGM